MQVFIDEKQISEEELLSWKIKRAKKAAKILNFSTKIEHKTDENFLNEFNDYKLKFTHGAILKRLRFILALSNIAMKVAAKISRKRKMSLVIIKIPNITAKEISDGIHQLMTEISEEVYRKNLSAYPEHFALLPSKNGMFEVIETPGNSPLPIRFFISFEEENGLFTHRDFSFQYQSVGVAKLSSGAIIGGVRHQFRDIKDGCEIRLCVEFPSIVFNNFIRAHQWHLATEFSYWLDTIIRDKGIN